MGPGLKLTTDLHIVSRLRIKWATPLPKYILMVCRGTDQPVCLSLILIHISSVFPPPFGIYPFVRVTVLSGVALTNLWNVTIGSPTATGHFLPSLYLEYFFLCLVYVCCPAERGTHSCETPVAVYNYTGCHNLRDGICIIIAMRI